jgi:hypothetical protein
VPDYKERAEFYRKRAAQLRAQVEGLKDDGAQATLRHLARDYEILAAQIEVPMNDTPPQVTRKPSG